MLALYRRPDDMDAFLKHYREVHTPLVERVPGLAKLVVNHVTADAFGGEPEFVLIAELHFPDRDSLRSALRSDENRAVGRDLMEFAPGLATVLIADSDEMAV